MDSENDNLNNERLARAFEHKSMIFTSRKNKFINEYNQIFKSYTEICVETDTFTQKINSLLYVYEHETKINNFYHSYINISKDVDSLGVTNREIHFLENNINELTKEQRLKISINRNAALILRMEKQLNMIHLKLNERKSHFITSYKKYLLNRN